MQQVEEQPPPGQETAIVGAGVLDTRIGQMVEPGVEVGEEMPDGLDESAAGDQGRPALSFSQRARARSRATVS